MLAVMNIGLLFPRPLQLQFNCKVFLAKLSLSARFVWGNCPWIHLGKAGKISQLQMSAVMIPHDTQEASKHDELLVLPGMDSGCVLGIRSFAVSAV